MKPKFWLAGSVLLLAGFYAWHQGTFSSSDYRELERREAEITRKLSLLGEQVDSLRALRDSLESSAVVQERYAREQWGVIRNGELSFRIRIRTPPGDSSRVD